MLRLPTIYGELPIERLHLSERAYQALLRNGVSSLADLHDAIISNKIGEMASIGVVLEDEIRKTYFEHIKPLTLVERD